jgi:hypothetical protein
VDFLKVQIWGRSATATAAVEYCSCSVVVETLSLVRYPWRRCALLVLCCCCSWMVFLVPSRATVAARVYLLVLVWLSGIILSSKG